MVYFISIQKWQKNQFIKRLSPNQKKHNFMKHFIYIKLFR
jgi:hypothetical protein